MVCGTFPIKPTSERRHLGFPDVERSVEEVNSYTRTTFGGGIFKPNAKMGAREGGYDCERENKFIHF